MKTFGKIMAIILILTGIAAIAYVMDVDGKIIEFICDKLYDDEDVIDEKIDFDEA